MLLCTSCCDFNDLNQSDKKMKNFSQYILNSVFNFVVCFFHDKLAASNNIWNIILYCVHLIFLVLPATSTMSPGTMSLALILWTLFLSWRYTFPISGSYSLRASMAFSAFRSLKVETGIRLKNKLAPHMQLRG